MNTTRACVPALLFVFAAAAPAAGQDLTTLVGTETSELAPVVERYSTDRTALGRRWSVPYSPERNAYAGPAKRR